MDKISSDVSRQSYNKLGYVMALASEVSEERTMLSEMIAITEAQTWSTGIVRITKFST